tara:strand:+ start:448 stop:690 length:243 start_codon:yes stop_codon:yes gene_type:complete
MKTPKFKQFKLPNKFLTQLYELTGGKGCYKGFIMAYADENGVPVVYTSCESKILENGLIKSLEDYLAHVSEPDIEEQESE